MATIYSEQEGHDRGWWQEDPFPHFYLSIVAEAVYERLRCLVPGDGPFEGSYLRLKIYTGVASIMCYGKSSGNS
jgi:hypothetical protein